LEFPARAAAVGAPGLAVAFNHLLGSVSLSRNVLTVWLDEWEKIINSLSSAGVSASRLVEKKIYFQAAMDSILKSEKPQDLLWPLINTWTEAISLLPENNNSQLAWIKALTTLGFAGKDYQIRLAALDSFLELCETLIIGETAEI
jgi:AAA15 family ATPase/GTPase